MITVPKLSTESFKDIFEFARRNFEFGYPNKIDMSYQDPAQTMLEMFSLLIDMQRYYMEFIGEEHYKKYIRLLGYNQRKIEYAKASVDPSLLGGAKIFPRDYPYRNEDIYFETLKFTNLSDSGYTGTIEMEQRRTWCKAETQSFIPGEPFVLTSYFALYKNTEFFVLTEKGYTEHKNYTLKKDIENGCAEVTILGIEKPSVCLMLYYCQEFESKRIISLKSVPNQTVSLDIPDLDDDSVRLHLARMEGGREYWEEWTRVDDFDNSRPYDLHFKIEDGNISFGNREHGEIPVGKLKIISCVSSLGGRGNIHNNIINAEGGKNKPSVQDIVALIPSDLQKIHKAVTFEDYRAILFSMTAVKLDRVHIISKENVISIIVKPKDSNFLSVITKADKQAIRSYLEPYRIITTKITIDTASYYPLNISIKAVFDSEWDDCEDRTIERIAEFFPCVCFKNDAVRPFGEKLFFGEIFVLISSMPWITSLEELKINDSQDDIQLNDDTLVYVDSIKFEKVSE